MDAPGRIGSVDCWMPSPFLSMKATPLTIPDAVAVGTARYSRISTASRRCRRIWRERFLLFELQRNFQNREKCIDQTPGAVRLLDPISTMIFHICYRKLVSVFYHK